MIVLDLGGRGLLRIWDAVTVAVAVLGAVMTLTVGGSVAVGKAVTVGRSVAMGVAMVTVVTVGRTMGRTVAAGRMFLPVAVVMAVGRTVGGFSNGCSGRIVLEINTGLEGTETLAQDRSYR